MSAAFTPGPWWIDEDRSDEYDGVLIVGPRTDATRYGVKDEWEIAAVRADWDHDEYLDSDVVGLIAEANARLIATAPELYQEVEFLCARLRELETMILDDEVGNEYYGHVAPSRARLEMLLEKARCGQ